MAENRFEGSSDITRKYTPTGNDQKDVGLDCGLVLPTAVPTDSC